MATFRQMLENTIEEFRFVKDNELNLKNAYGEDYLAISRSRVVDHNSNQAELIEKVKGKGCAVGRIDDFTSPEAEKIARAAREIFEKLYRAA